MEKIEKGHHKLELQNKLQDFQVLKVKTPHFYVCIYTCIYTHKYRYIYVY